MSAARHDPAFPSHGSMGEVCHTGMTLRDYFAARAAEYIQWNTGTTTLNAARCYEIADALLKARGA